MEIKFTIKNQGSAAAPASYAEVDVASHAIQTFPVSPLAAGQSEDFDLKTSYPSDKVEVKIIADSKKQVAELHESNNTREDHFTPAPRPDLIVEHVKIEQIKRNPAEVRVTISLKNKGKADAGPFALTAWQPENPGYVDSFTFSGLRAGKSQEVKYVSVPVNFEPCTYIAVVDPNNQVLESDEGNNRKSAQLKIKSDPNLPDLVLNLKSASIGTDTSGQVRLMLVYSVRNASHVDVTTPITVEIRYESNKLQPVYQMLAALKGEQEVDVSVGAPLGSTPSDLYGTRADLIVDPNNAITESNKFNNAAVITIPGGKPPASPVLPNPPAKDSQ